jgi:hypothetical protein
MDLMDIILAQGNGATPPAVPDGVIVPPVDQTVPPSFLGRMPVDEFWQAVVKLGWLESIICIAFAAIYLMYGWRVFKVLVVLNCGLIGLFVGRILGTKLGSPLWGALMGTTIISLLSLPFIKYSVAVLGALAGAVMGAAIWRVATLPEPLIWSGALAGLVAGGFLAFSSFKVSVMLFTSLQGSAFLAMGSLALLNDYPDFSVPVATAVYNRVFLLPLLLIVPTIIGVIFQQMLLKREAKWAMPETEGFQRK